jgi:predicted nuclease of predicted toxin-antitoxin system
VKLLLDQNLSVRLVAHLSDLFPGSAHTSLVGLERAPDARVWEFAQDNNFVVVSKDSDLIQISLARGLPPSIVWIRRGNCSTPEVEAILRRNATSIDALPGSDGGGILELR